MSVGHVGQHTGVQGTQTQGTTGTQGTLGNHTVRVGNGTSIKRAISDFFRGIGDSFKTLGDRISKSHERRIEKARTSAANKATDKLVAQLTSGTPSGVKVMNLMTSLIQKAAKLDPNDPVGKAEGMLTARLLNMSDDEKSDFFKHDFAAMKQGFKAVFEHRQQRANLVLDGLNDIMPQEGFDQAKTDGLNPTYTDVLQLLDDLDQEAVQHFAPSQNQIAQGLDTYFAPGKITEKTMFRGDAQITKDMKKQLERTMPNDTEAKLQSAIQKDCHRIAKQLGDIPVDAYGGISDENLSPELLTALLQGAEDVMKNFIGGADANSIQAFANSLPKEAVRLLQNIDGKVAQHLPGNDDARETAFVGTLFLRFLTPAAFNVQVGMQDGPDKQVVRFMSKVVTDIFNQAGDTMRGRLKFPTQEMKQQYSDFVESFAPIVAQFRTAVLNRTV